MRGLMWWVALGLVLFALPHPVVRALGGEQGAPKEIAVKKNPIAVSDGVLVKTRKSYQDNCAQCHGGSGKGDGPMAGMLAEPPADLSNTRIMARITDGETFWNITKGKAPVMPAFESKLTEEERWSLVHVLRELSKTEPNNKPQAGK